MEEKDLDRIARGFYAEDTKPQEIPDFVMVALKAVRREQPSLTNNISGLVHHWMFSLGYLEAAFWCVDNGHERAKMLTYGAVCKGYRPVPGVFSSYKEVSNYHKTLYGAGTMTRPN
jgi:hypothetical protein